MVSAPTAFLLNLKQCQRGPLETQTYGTDLHRPINTIGFLKFQKWGPEMISLNNGCRILAQCFHHQRGKPTASEITKPDFDTGSARAILLIRRSSKHPKSAPDVGARESGHGSPEKRKCREGHFLLRCLFRKNRNGHGSSNCRRSFVGHSYSSK